MYNFFFFTGDLNHNRVVNLDDFNILAANFGQSPRTWSQGDVNYDGMVNLDDFNILTSRFGNTLDAPPSGPNGVSISSFQGLPRITLNWLDAATGEEGYRIQRSPATARPSPTTSIFPWRSTSTPVSRTCS